MQKEYQFRWYDQEPTLSLAVSLFSNTKKKNQKVVAEYIISVAKERDISLKNKINDFFNFFVHRWYDHDELIYTAMEYLKAMPPELQKEIALDLVEKLHQIEGKPSTTEGGSPFADSTSSETAENIVDKLGETSSEN